jgi:hypothetical protein
MGPWEGTGVKGALHIIKQEVSVADIGEVH